MLRSKTVFGLLCPRRIKVIAEGVETEEEMRTLVSL